MADGAVKVVSNQTAASGKPARTRTSTSEHMEYYADDGKVIIQGGKPVLVDSIKGKTTGQQLTWYANDDTLHRLRRGKRAGAKHHPQEEVARAHSSDHGNHEVVSRAQGCR